MPGSLRDGVGGCFTARVGSMTAPAVFRTSAFAEPTAVLTILLAQMCVVEAGDDLIRS